MLLFFSGFPALHSRCPQGCPLPPRQVAGVHTCSPAWPGISHGCGAGRLWLHRAGDRTGTSMVWEMDHARWCQGLCHLGHEGKAAVLGGMG